MKPKPHKLQGQGPESLEDEDDSMASGGSLAEHLQAINKDICDFSILVKPETQQRKEQASLLRLKEQRKTVEHLLNVKRQLVDQKVLEHELELQKAELRHLAEEAKSLDIDKGVRERLQQRSSMCVAANPDTVPEADRPAADKVEAVAELRPHDKLNIKVHAKMEELGDAVIPEDSDPEATERQQALQVLRNEVATQRQLLAQLQRQQTRQQQDEERRLLEIELQQVSSQVEHICLEIQQPEHGQRKSSGLPLGEPDPDSTSRSHSSTAALAAAVVGGALVGIGGTRTPQGPGRRAVAGVLQARNPEVGTEKEAIQRQTLHLHGSESSVLSAASLTPPLQVFLPTSERREGTRPNTGRNILGADAAKASGSAPSVLAASVDQQIQSQMERAEGAFNVDADGSDDVITRLLGRKRPQSLCSFDTFSEPQARPAELDRGGPDEPAAQAGTQALAHLEFETPHSASENKPREAVQAAERLAMADRIADLLLVELLTEATSDGICKTAAQEVAVAVAGKVPAVRMGNLQISNLVDGILGELLEELVAEICASSRPEVLATSLRCLAASERVAA